MKSMPCFSYSKILFAMYAKGTSKKVIAKRLYSRLEREILDVSDCAPIAMMRMVQVVLLKILSLSEGHYHMLLTILLPFAFCVSVRLCVSLCVPACSLLIAVS